MWNISGSSLWSQSLCGKLLCVRVGMREQQVCKFVCVYFDGSACRPV